MPYVRTLPRLRRCLSNRAALLAAIVLVVPACAAQAPPESKPPEVQLPSDLKKYPGLLPELGRLLGKLQHNIQYPPARAESRLLPLLPESTLLYVASPNYGDVLHQALTIFRQEREENSVLRDWWQHGEVAAAGPKVEDALEKLYQLSLYLGDEIVVSGRAEGKDPKLLVVAELRKPGLKQFLQQMVDDFAGKSKPPVRLFDPQELATREEKPGAEQLLVLVRQDFIVAANDLATLRSFNARMDRGSREFASVPFGQRVAQAYQGGVTMVSAVDLQKILSFVPIPTEQNRLLLQRSGFADVKYAIWEHRSAAGLDFSEAELSFTGPRHGVASWLAAPAALGSLDFVSPKAALAGTVVLKDPVQIFEDVKELATAANSNAIAGVAQMEQALKVSLKDDLLSLLGGEITLELDSFPPKEFVWRAMLRVNDPDHLQRTLSTLLAVANYLAEQSDEGGVTYRTIRIPSAKTPTEVGYAFVDGYMIVASSRAAVAESVRLHRSGEALGKSPKLQASLPPSHPLGFSAMFYQDTGAMTSLGLQQLPPEMAQSLAQLGGEAPPTVICAYGEQTAIREQSTSSASALDAGVILIVAAIAIPNLLRSRMAANEASAVGTLRSVNTAQVTYASIYPQRGYAPDLATLGPDPHEGGGPSADHADIIDSGIGNASCTAGEWCTKSGYRFTLKATCIQQMCAQYVVVGTPVSEDTGKRNFCSVEDGVIRYSVGPPLTAPIRASECRKWAPLQ